MALLRHTIHHAVSEATLMDMERVVTADMVKNQTTIHLKDCTLKEFNVLIPKYEQQYQAEGRKLVLEVVDDKVMFRALEIDVYNYLEQLVLSKPCTIDYEALPTNIMPYTGLLKRLTC